MHFGKTFWTGLPLILFLFAVMTFGGVLTNPADVRDVNAENQFNTERAFTRIENILADEIPHPVDTDANDAVRARLIGEIKALGFTANITGGPACNTSGRLGFMACSHVKNVSFQMGPEGDDAVMVTTHYDSVPAGPGAADASIGVATILEIAAVLKGEDLKRPLLFMFTDGEEGGLMGANYFVRDDPRAKRVKTIVNFEARGTRGPAFMFETSRPNGRVIPAFAKYTARPNANSVMAAVYDLIPNSTDVAVYLPKDYEALNFAVVHGLPFYHTPHDNLTNLSKPSLQHMGDQGLAAVKALAIQPDLANDTQYIYGDFLSRFFFMLPQVLALPILIIAAALALILFWRAEPRTTRLRILAVPPLALMVAALDAWILQWILKAIRGPGDYWWAHGWATQGFAVFVAIAGALFMLRVLTPRATRWQVTFAGWLWFLVPGFVCAALLPGAMILFVLPAIAFIIAAIIYLIGRDAARWIFALAALFSLLILVPLFSSLGVTLGYGIAPILALVGGLALLPWYGALMPMPENKYAVPTWQTFWIAAGGVAILFIAALVLPAASTPNPKPMNVTSYVDLDGGEAFTGLSGKDRPRLDGVSLPDDLAQKQMLPRFRQEWIMNAPMSDVTAPSLTETDRSVSGQITTVNLRINANSADRVGILIPKASGIETINFEGITAPMKGIGTDREFVIFRCAGRSCDGSDLAVTLSGQAATDWQLFGESWGVQPSGQAYINGRPKTATPIQAGDRTIVLKKQKI